MDAKSKLLQQIRKIKVWSKNDRISVHKPLLILYALSLYKKNIQELQYDDIEKPITDLLNDFGGSNSRQTPSYPFWRLRNDGFWVIDKPELVTTSVSGDAHVSSLKVSHIHGGFSPEVISLFKQDSKLVDEIVLMLLWQCFPESWHDEILKSIGFDFDFDLNVIVKKKRDPKFRGKILNAYQYACAVCDMSLQLGNQWVILEAAHIKWHTVNGTDEESNGLALCSIHHKLFDRGAFTLNDDDRVIVSESIHGNGVDELLLKYHGVEINKPINKKYFPDLRSKMWHRSEVFRGRAREQ